MFSNPVVLSDKVGLGRLNDISRDLRSYWSPLATFISVL